MNSLSTEASLPHYVVGFLMNDEASGVALIKKLRPDWQNGLLNGVGGLIKADETPEQAMARESLEEFGVTPPTWIPFTTLPGPENQDPQVIHYFYARHTATLRNIKQITDEAPVKVYLADLPTQPTIPDLQTLIPLALAASSSQQLI